MTTDPLIPKATAARILHCTSQHLHNMFDDGRLHGEYRLVDTDALGPGQGKRAMLFLCRSCVLELAAIRRSTTASNARQWYRKRACGWTPPEIDPEKREPS